MPPRKRPIAELADRTRYRYGDRDTPATTDHAQQSREWRRQNTVEAMAPFEADILTAIAAGVHMRRAAAIGGFTIGALHGRAQWDTDWRDRLDAALRAGRDPLLPHGREAGYRAGCRCPDCRDAHNHTRQAPRSGARWVAAARKKRRPSR